MSNTQAPVEQPNCLTGQQMGTSILQSRLLPSAATHHFLLVLLRGSVSVDFGSSLDTAPSSLPASRALNLFSSCRSAGGTGAIFLVPEVTSFQPLLSFPNPTGSDLACPSFGAAVGLRLLYPQHLRKAQVPLLFVISDIIQPPDLHPQLLSLVTQRLPQYHLLWTSKLSASARSTKHPTAWSCRAASSLGSSLCLEAQLCQG